MLYSDGENKHLKIGPTSPHQSDSGFQTARGSNSLLYSAIPNVPQCSLPRDNRTPCATHALDNQHINVQSLMLTLLTEDGLRLVFDEHNQQILVVGEAT